MTQRTQKKVLAAIFCLAFLVVLLEQSSNQTQVGLKVEGVSYRFNGSNVVATLTVQNHGPSLLYWSDRLGQPTVTGHSSNKLSGEVRFVVNKPVRETKLHKKEKLSVDVPLPLETKGWESLIYVQTEVAKSQMLQRFRNYLPNSLVSTLASKMPVMRYNFGPFIVPDNVEATLPSIPI